MKKAIYLATIILLIVSAIIVYSFINSPPHKFKEGQCAFCHLNYEPPFLFRDNINTLCNYCHKNDKALSHIVGLKPSMQLPAELHLDENGEMTCNTCHSIHMDKVDLGTGSRTYLLRINKIGKEFCNACHLDVAEIVEPGHTPTHADVLETAHLGYYAGEEHSIDRVSLLCIGCHEGVIASSAPYSTKKYSNPIGHSHRIGMSYARAFRKSSDIRSPRSLSPAIMLFGGKVGCTSCHNPFKLDKHKLSMTNEESALCLECHIK